MKSESLTEALNNLCELKDHFSKGNFQKCLIVITKIKFWVSNSLLHPSYSLISESTKRQEISVAREALEYAAFACLHLKHLTAFERNYAMLKVYHSDYRHLITRSQHEPMLTGLNLLLLLSEKRIEEFHVELELLPSELFTEPYICQLLEAEQSLSTGAFNKVLEVIRKNYSPDFQFLTELFYSTVREEMGTCLEKSYRSLHLNEVERMLSMQSEAEAKHYGESKGWKIVDGRFVFAHTRMLLQQPSLKHLQDFNPIQIIIISLIYAKELEKIL